MAILRDCTMSLGIAVDTLAPSVETTLERDVIDLFDQFRRPLLRYIFTFGLATHDAEELVQEVFLALFLHLRQGKSRANLRGWLFRVSHNLALKRWRDTRKMQFHCELDDEAFAERPNLDPNPEELAIGRQRYDHLQAVLAALPFQDRCCLSLRAEGLRYREIGKILGMSLGAVSISLTRALARFGRADENHRSSTKPVKTHKEHARAER
jgi:RNA polymerase sigma-70 factor (ECF subfamily)